MRITSYEVRYPARVPIRGKLLKTLGSQASVQVWIAKDRRILEEINDLRRSMLKLTSDSIQRTTFASRSSSTTGMGQFSLQLDLEAINWDKSTIELKFTLAQGLRGVGETVSPLWRFSHDMKVRDHLPIIYLVRYSYANAVHQSVIVFDVAREPHRDY